MGPIRKKIYAWVPTTFSSAVKKWGWKIWKAKTIKEWLKIQEEKKEPPPGDRSR